jgi:hypothetical protein
MNIIGKRIKEYDNLRYKNLESEGILVAVNRDLDGDFAFLILKDDNSFTSAYPGYCKLDDRERSPA